MTGPENLRVYGLLLRRARVLIAAETVAGRAVWKYPGGGVEAGETPEAALAREWIEECGLAIRPRALLHVPGTLFSPWTHTDYTPLYYAVEAAGRPRVPPGEAIRLSFLRPDEAIASGRMAAPEITALRRLLGRAG